MSNLYTSNCCWADPGFIGQKNFPSGTTSGNCPVLVSITTTSVCNNVILNHCVNEPNTIEEFKERWNAGNIFNIKKEPYGDNSFKFSRSCYYPLARYLTDSTIRDKFPIQNVSGVYSALTTGNTIEEFTGIDETNPSLDLAKKLISELLIKYQKSLKYDVLKEPGSSGAEPVSANGLAFSSQLFNVCKSVPILCNNDLFNSNFLNSICQSVTKDQITSTNDLLRKWCGCYMQNDVYGDAYPNITRECTPFCNSDTVIGIAEGTSISDCKQSICIIDDITINLIENRGGAISLGNLCGDCSGKNQVCKCQIGGSNLTLINNELRDISGGNLNLNTTCKNEKEIKCYDNYKGVRTEVPCQTSGDKTTEQLLQQEEIAKITRSSFISFAIPFIILGVVVLAVVLYLLFERFLKFSKK